MGTFSSIVAPSRTYSKTLISIHSSSKTKKHRSSDYQLGLDPSNLPASPTPHTPVHSLFCFPAAEDPPIYINAKQFQRILRRRTARLVLEEESSTRDTRLLLSKRRHEEEVETLESKESTTQSSGSKTSPIPMQARVPGSKTKLQLTDPKRMRIPDASARFRAR
jgi:hypothetical protein